MAAPANHWLGQLHAAIGGQQQAVHCFEQALSLSPVRATLHHHLGIALLALGRYPEAEASLRQSIERKPWAWWSYLTLGELMQQQGRLMEAESFFRKTLALNNAEPWAYYHLYEIEHTRVGREMALDNWLDAVLAAPQMPGLRLNIGLLWLDEANYTVEHIGKLRQVTRRYPRNQDVRFFLGCLLSRLGEVSAARETLAEYMAHAWQQGYSTRIAPLTPVKDPEFLIIGTSKSGSSAMYDYLIDHPLICPAIVKEVDFWTTYYSHGHDWYRACFMPIPASAAHITGEASIGSLWYAQAPQRVAAFRPDMKLLLLLRDPVARAYSEYHMHKRLGEAMPRWEECVRVELEKFPQCPLEPDDLPDPYDESNILTNGAVLPFLKRWLRHFPAKQFLILRSEDLSRDVCGTVSIAYKFLGLPPHQLTSTARHNVGSYPPLPRDIELRLRQWFQPHERALSEFLAAEMA
jgi:tetratricopeptide (TPR) repeat protein